MHRLSCVGLGCIFTSFPSRLPFSPLAFPPVPSVSPVPVLGPSWRPGRAEQHFQPRLSLERWELPLAPGTVPWGAAEGRCPICCRCPGELLCMGGGDRGRGCEDGAAGIPQLQVLFKDTWTCTWTGIISCVFPCVGCHLYRNISIYM